MRAGRMTSRLWDISSQAGPGRCIEFTNGNYANWPRVGHRVRRNRGGSLLELSTPVGGAQRCTANRQFVVVRPADGRRPIEAPILSRSI